MIKKNLTLSLTIYTSLIIIIINFFRFFQNNTSYQFDPWLSNYQGGFVRRGVPGELFYQVYNLFNLHLGWVVFLSVSLLYFFTYFNFLKLIKNLKINFLYIFIILSPLSFYFPVLNSKASGHKEILFLFFLSLFCLIIPKIKRKHSFYIIIIISIIVSLSYEVLTFYLIYLVLPYIYFYDFKNLKELFIPLTLIVFLSFFLLLINFFFKGNNQIVAEICNSIIDYVNNQCQNVGKIADLKLSIKDHTAQKSMWNYGEQTLYPTYLKIYGFGLVWGFLPLLILYNKIKITKFPANELNFKPLIILIFPLFFAFPVYYLGADWGRYLHISYMSSLIFTFFCIKNNIFLINKNSTETEKRKPFKYILILVLIIYSFGWTVPICCEKEFKPGLLNAIKNIKINYDKYN